MSPHNKSSLIYVVGTIILATVLCTYALRDHHKMQAALPVPKTITQAEADKRPHLTPILGTGSMRPLIPAGRPDEVVAYRTLDRRDFALLGKGELVVFRHQSGATVLHQLASLDGSAGWITSGSHNKSYDTGRVTRANYLGRAVDVYILQK